MGRRKVNMTGLAPHLDADTSTIDYRYQVGQDDQPGGWHDFSPPATKAEAQDVWAEAGTSETAWLNEMPASVKSWVQARPLSERSKMRDLDVELGSL